MTAWKRSDSIRLGTSAMQVGLADIDEAERALQIGARLLVHGFAGADIDRAVMDHYARVMGRPE